MMIKDIMVHLDGSSEDEIRLGYAQLLSSPGPAHVTGVYTNLLPDFTMAVPMDGGAIAMQALTEVEEKARREGDDTARRLADHLASLGAPTHFRRFDETFAVVSARLAAAARCADLFVATRPYGEGATGTALGVDLVEAVLFGSGRGLFLVPPGHRPAGPIRTALVAWNGSREAARALREAMSVIEHASRVVVLLVDARLEEQGATEVADHLSRHGVRAEIVTRDSADRQVADIILDEASRLSADLIVMGGYGHTRMREQILGGVTASLLRRSPLPVLTAH
jgi:nucleotide-binding universal stress UspA family protein